MRNRAVESTFLVARNEEWIEVEITGILWPPEPDVGIFGWTPELHTAKVDGEPFKLLNFEIVQAEERLLSSAGL